SRLRRAHCRGPCRSGGAEACRDPGPAPVAPPPPVAPPAPPAPTYPAALLLQRRSAVALDGVSSISRDRFLAMLAHAMPGDAAPFDAIWWKPCIHFVLFV